METPHHHLVEVEEAEAGMAAEQVPVQAAEEDHLAWLA